MNWIDDIRREVSALGEDVREGVRRTLPKVESFLDDMDRKASKRKKRVYEITQPLGEAPPLSIEVKVPFRTDKPWEWVLIDLSLPNCVYSPAVVNDKWEWLREDGQFEVTDG